MSERQPYPYDSIARKWLALAERRRAHLIALRENGRWQRYYTEAQISAQLRELDIASRRFAAIGGVDAVTEGPAGTDECDHDAGTRDAA